MTGSLAYRQNEAAIVRGDVPAKYTRILPHIPPGDVLELGSAEGVLALLLAREGRKVTAVEANKERHASARKLAQAWGQSGVRFVRGNILQNLDLLAGKDVFVAVRSIYYLRADLDTVLAEVAKHIPNVVLCGNKGRAHRYHQGNPDLPLGPMNYYAGAEGMKALLTRHGYRAVSKVADGDAIVVGRKG